MIELLIGFLIKTNLKVNLVLRPGKYIHSKVPSGWWLEAQAWTGSVDGQWRDMGMGEDGVLGGSRVYGVGVRDSEGD